MAFGIKLDVKVEAPKVVLPKVDVAATVGGAASALSGAVLGAVDGVKSAVTSAVGGVTGAVLGAASAAAGAVASLASVAGAIGEVAVSFTGLSVDLVLEPHAVLDANADYEETQFEKGPIFIVIDLSPEEAQVSTDRLRVFTASGAYDESLAICDGYAEADDNGDSERAPMVAVRFEDAPMSERFSLEIIPEGRQPYLVFDSVPYGDLRRDKLTREDADPE